MLFDAIFIIYMAVNVFLGYRYGLFRRVIHIGFFFLGMLLAQALSPGFAEQFGYGAGPHPADAHFAVYLGVLFGLVVIAEALGFLYADALGFLNTMLADRFLGVLLGLVGAVLELSVLLFLFGQLVNVSLPSGGSHAPIVQASQEQVGQSIIARQLKKAEPSALIVFRPVLPPNPPSYFAKTYT
ncbi:MAG: CvpA family protein [Candidatus Dormibacteria bacterium]